MSAFRTVCQASDIPTGEARMFVVNGAMVGVFHIGEEFFAIDNRCPHAGASLAGGIIEQETVRCRIHHWKFCIRDGTYLDEDKPRFNARTFPVRVVGDDVQVRL
ncbi:MAG: Rieske (2Fe-2S) protein [Planctomycetaceae bacterium]|nr:Rieske (2Fe-2S) protein [Planctomycetales bacterium]MCB9875912.1 Rieske (2Fe-2S) protein [Planctomycetaceae bacterium]MCB9937462.1 Rieske (2Fe-2S) protein [Planctomycetaceae bacterium]